MKTLLAILTVFITACPFRAHANPVPVITTRLVESFPIQMYELIEYPVYINAWMDDEPGVDIDRVEVTVDDEAVVVKQGNGFYYFLFRPEEFKSFDIAMTAYGTNGQSSSIYRSVEVSKSVSTQTVRTLDDVVIEFGGLNSRWFTGTFELPQYAGTYEQVMAHFDVDCPPIAGGCDDWDRLAWVEVKAPDGEWVELIRYITPYGRGCDHLSNVTALNSLLQGEVEFRVFIDTWGTGGWQLTLDLEHRKGFPLYAYTRVDKVWDASYDFGNPANLQPVPEVSFELPINSRQSKLFLSNTGHGWGQNNSFNAAEFFHAVHKIEIDGTERFTHDMWTDCDPNPDGCTGQSGSWFYDRAGWCPGAISPAKSFDITSDIGDGPHDISYIFHESYVDNCHANNPACVSGVTCTDCNDGYNPIYYVDAWVVSYSDVPLLSDDYTEPPPLPTAIFENYSNRYAITGWPNPSAGRFQLMLPGDLKDAARVQVYSVDGVLQKSFYFRTAEELAAFTFDLSGLPKGSYFMNVNTKSGNGSFEVILN